MVAIVEGRVLVLEVLAVPWLSFLAAIIKARSSCSVSSSSNEFLRALITLENKKHICSSAEEMVPSPSALESEGSFAREAIKRRAWFTLAE
jgi:hypothetical protein